MQFGGEATWRARLATVRDAAGETDGGVGKAAR